MNNFLTELQPTLVTLVAGMFTALCGFVISFINKKREELTANITDKTAQKYANMLSDTITKCVITTNQTYVDALKHKDAFTPEAQKEAFQITLDNVKAVLSIEAQNYYEEMTGDLNTFLKVQIEAQVNNLKKETA